MRAPTQWTWYRQQALGIVSIRIFTLAILTCVVLFHGGFNMHFAND